MLASQHPTWLPHPESPLAERARTSVSYTLLELLVYTGAPAADEDGQRGAPRR